MDLFQEEIEQTAIERIQKFAKIAKTMGFEVRLGFSGVKILKSATTFASAAALSSARSSTTRLRATRHCGLSVSITPK